MVLTPLPVGGHVEVVAARDPLLMLLQQERAKESDSGGTIGEDAKPAAQLETVVGNHPTIRAVRECVSGER